MYLFQIKCRELSVGLKCVWVLRIHLVERKQIIQNLLARFLVSYWITLHLGQCRDLVVVVVIAFIRNSNALLPIEQGALK